MIECCMRMAVCDDDPRDLEQIAAMMRAEAQLRGIACELTLYESGAELLAAMQNGEKYHALWMDVLPAGNGQSRIMSDQLMYAEMWERGMRLFLTDGQVDVNLKMSELQALLPKNQFVLCQRTYLVNMAFVQNIRRCELQLKNGADLLVNKYRFMEVKEKLIAYLRD